MILSMVLLVSNSLFGQNNSSEKWLIRAEKVNPNSYYSITVANGMVGLVSSPNPLVVEFHPFSFWPKLSEKILGMLMVVDLFGKALLELRPKAETEGAPCRAMFVQLG